MPDSDDLRELARGCLEAAREEVLRRLRDNGLPTSTTAQQLHVVENEDMTGWKSEWQAVPRSSLTLSSVLMAIDDTSIEAWRLGLREQLQPLAEAVALRTALGASVPRGLPRSESAAENALVSYVRPLAFAYVTLIPDVAHRDEGLLDRLLDELMSLIERGKLWQRGQLALDGVRVPTALSPHRGVKLRPLSPVERGAWVEARGVLTPLTQRGEFLVPLRYDHFTPRVVVDWTEPTEPGGEDTSRLHHRLALAFFLRGHDIASAGSCVLLADPRWASLGILNVPVPVETRTTPTPPAEVDQREFAAIVDLAFSIPPFGAEEATRTDVVLYRLLRGCGADGTALLDLAISLEAALLKDTTELAYRFRLYGSLFLAPEFAASESFRLFKEVYDVRSRLVHGAPVPAERLRAAEETARNLATAVTKKSVETSWPAQAALDQAALAGQLDEQGRDG